MYKFYGWALIAGTLAFLGTGTLHPSGRQMLADVQTFAHYAPINVLAHSLALAGVWISLTGIVGLSRRFSLDRPVVVAALVSFSLAAVLVSLAAVVDGIVSTRLADAYVHSDVEADRKVLAGFMQYSYNIASSISRYYVCAVAVAVLLFSWVAWRDRFDRGLAVAGATIAVAGFIAMVTGHLRMDVHDVLLLALGQGIWMLWAGVALLRERPGALQDR